MTNDPVMDAWLLFARTGEIDAKVVRPEVAASWRRCRKQGLDPRAQKLAVRVEPGRLQETKERNRTLIETALPFMENLSNAARGGQFLLALTDYDGVVLEVFGDEHVADLARGNNFVPGCIRSEKAVGTNAICLALSERKPVHLAGAEHYTIGHHPWTCSSAPIFGHDGQLLGTVTLSIVRAHANSLTLGTVISAAEAIHDRLCERETRRLSRRTMAVLSSVLDCISEAIITIDASGLVETVNPTAARLLGVRPENAAGKSLLNFFPGSPELARVLIERADSRPIEVSGGARPRGRLFVSPHFMRSEGGPDGAFLILRAARDQLNELRDIAGYTAAITFDDIIGESAEIRKQIDLARIAAVQGSRILIAGETGTGKELFAQSIHNASSRRDGPFVALNCAAIPRDLLESELFGYKGGAFTGSQKGGQIGKFELADGGTLFLDEISTMPLDLQPKLLRTLQDGSLTRLGDARPLRVDVRVIAATNEDLYQKSLDQAFRMDLYFRLSVVEIHLPPLRERGGDIALIADHILVSIAAKMGRSRLSLSPEAMDMLNRYPWIGNVRELENVLEMAVIVCAGDVLEPAHLAYRMRSPRPVSAPATRPEPVARPKSMRDAELDLICNTMREHDGNVALVSRILGISRSSIYRRMKEAGLSRADWSS